MERLRCGIVGGATIELMKRDDLKFIGWGDLNELDEIASKVGLTGRSPFQRHKRILDALDRDKRFEKSYFRGCDSSGRREMMVRCFKLISNNRGE